VLEGFHVLPGAVDHDQLGGDPALGQVDVPGPRRGLGFGRIAASKLELRNMLVNLVYGG
jgi:hypothetical protein